MVRLKAGTFKNSFVKLPGAKASAAAASVANTGKRQLASNILIVSGSKSATGKPLFVGGPQIGFNYPGLTMEMQLHVAVDQRRGRDLRAVPRLHAHRPRHRLRVVADLGGRRHHRHLRRDAVRRVEDEVRVEGQVPADGEGRRRHDPKGAQDGRLTSTAPSTARSSATRRTATRQAGGAVAQALVLRARHRRPAVQPADDVLARPQREGLHQRRGQVAADVQLVLRERDRVRRSTRPARCRVRPKGVNGDLPSTAPASTSGRASWPRASTRRSSTRRRATSSTGTTSRPRTSRPVTTASATRAASSASTCSTASSRATRRRRWPTCSPPPTRVRPRTSGSRSCGRR